MIIEDVEPEIVTAFVRITPQVAKIFKNRSSARIAEPLTLVLDKIDAGLQDVTVAMPTMAWQAKARPGSSCSTSARAALHHAKGELRLNEKVTIESILGSTMTVRLSMSSTASSYCCCPHCHLGQLFAIGVLLPQRKPA
jgi:proline racemase